MRTIDTRGQQCPAPLIATRKALRECVEGDSFGIISSSRNAVSNISKFLTDNKVLFSVNEEAGTWTITVSKSTGNSSATI